MCLDVLRALGRGSHCAEALAAELAPARGGNARLDTHIAELQRDIAEPDPAASDARRLAQRIALAVQGALLVRFAPDFVATAFCASRLAPGSFSGGVFGTLAPTTDLAAILERAQPG